MIRYNHRAYDRVLAMDGRKVKFYHYTTTAPVFDSVLQIPLLSGVLVELFADVQDFTVQQIQSSGGLIDLNSKLYIVSKDSVLQKGDEVLDSNKVEQYKVVLTKEFANRKFLYCNKTLDNPNTH